jgi:photosystem II stability/assembly factor-like uncharacterized protein
MFAHICTRLLLILCGLFVLTWIAAPRAASLADELSPTAQREITELEKQIGTLNKKLTELKNGSTAKAPVAKEGEFDPAWVKSLTWRSIGPASMGGRIVAISVFENDPSTYWIATASGGLLKTVNNGTTFEHQFAPSDRNIVWVGTGENNPRNSVSYGDGVYKSTDGGKTWKNMGLRKTFQIGKIIVHPKNPNIVYVGALGRLYGPNEDRGLYKTMDGGQTWQKILFVDDTTGVIDMRMNPADPEMLLVAMWERRRDEFDSHRGEPPVADGYDAYDPIKKWGPGSGLYRTLDGGLTFKKITHGLPSCDLGRMGLDWSRKEPRNVYVIVDCARIGMGRAGRGGQPGPAQNQAYLGVTGDDADAGARLTDVVAGGPAAKAKLQPGDIIVSADAKLILSYRELTEYLATKKPGETVKLKVARKRQGQDISVTLEARPALVGGRGQFGGNPNRPNSAMYGGQRENVQAQQGPNSQEYGGLYKSTDGGESWTRINSLNPRPMYFSQVRVDPSDEKYLYVCGVSLYRSSDGGKTFRPDGNTGVHPDQHALWIDPKDGRHMIVGCDGGFYATYDRMAHWDFLNHVAIGQFYHVALDNRRPYHVYGGLQDNGSWGGPSHSLAGGIINEDWISVSGGDGFVCRVDPNDADLVYTESQDGFIRRVHLRNGESAAIRPRDGQGLSARSQAVLSILTGLVGKPQFLNSVRTTPEYRFNWNTPFILSQHNSHIFYSAGNYVFRSFKRGDDLKAISPEISRTKRGTAFALAESPRNPDLLYVGTDDGYLWITRDSGNHWLNLSDRFNLPGPRWVSSIEPSRFEEGRAYLVFDAHRSDDDEPYVFVTEDYGQTWKSLRANLPTGSTHVLREDVQNPNLLYLGTEFGIWVSLDRGGHWSKLNNNLPTVAVHEIAVHPTAGEIVAATHGRSLWVLDVTPLRQMTPEVLHAKANLYRPSAAVRWRNEPSRGSVYGMGARRFTGQNPPRGAQIYYSLRQKADKVVLKVVDINGKTVRDFGVRNEPGLHRLDWDLNANPRTQGPGAGGRGGPGRGGQRGGGGRGQGGLAVANGVYRVVLSVDGTEFSQPLSIEADPTGAAVLIAPRDEDEDDDEDHDR